MINKKFWMGMLAKMLIFGLIAVGCDNGSTGGGGIETAGRVTITGLSAYNGKYVAAIRSDAPPYLIAASDITTPTNGTAGKITGDLLL